jgi:hypothetical protein
MPALDFCIKCGPTAVAAGPDHAPGSLCDFLVLAETLSSGKTLIAGSFLTIGSWKTHSTTIEGYNWVVGIWCQLFWTAKL